MSELFSCPSRVVCDVRGRWSNWCLRQVYHRAARVRVLSENTGYIHHILDILGYSDICFFGRLDRHRKEGVTRIYESKHRRECARRKKPREERV